MKISVDGVDLFELSEIQKSVIKNDINSAVFDEDTKRRLEYILMHKYECCFKRLREEWDEKLAANGVDMIPTDPDAYATLVFSQPNYKDRATRDAEAAALLNQ